MSNKPMLHCYTASYMVKFLEKRNHAEQFLSGAMLARRLNYFKDLEDDPARWDRNDGLRTYRHISSKPAPASPHLTHVGTVSPGDGAPRIRAMEISYTTDEAPYVICLSRFVSKNRDPATCLNQLAQQVREAGKMGRKFGAYAVVIDNKQERTFLDMLRQAARDRGYEVSSDAVTYRTGKMGLEPLDAFCKSAHFAPENEFRIALFAGEDVGTHLHLGIGDLSGIAEIHQTKSLENSRFLPL
ncbi:MAG: hypothetical protein OXC70_05265 [Gammaproteobacteria bacterium]|nr:hypothetical protein [Gammaproteobacteria bacterium]